MGSIFNKSFESSQNIMDFLNDSPYFRETPQIYKSSRLELFGVLYCQVESDEDMEKKIEVLFRKISELKSLKMQFEDIRYLMEKMCFMCIQLVLSNSFA